MNRSGVSLYIETFLSLGHQTGFWDAAAPYVVDTKLGLHSPPTSGFLIRQRSVLQR
jgi:hypothetical protein